MRCLAESRCAAEARVLTKLCRQARGGRVQPRRAPAAPHASSASAELSSDANAARLALLRAVAAVKRGGSSTARSEALAAVVALERCTPPGSAPTASPLLDGRWALLWTCSASDAEQASSSSDDAFGLGAAVQAASDAAYKFFYQRLPFIAGAAPAGAALGPARATGTWQTIDRAAKRVANEAELELSPGTFFSVVVGGSAVAGSATRLDVQFLDFQVKLGPRDGALSLSLPLSLIAPRGAVETTYLDQDVRIGRGDKGSVFVCARA